MISADAASQRPSQATAKEDVVRNPSSNASHAYLETDADGKITYLDPSYAATFGLTAPESALLQSLEPQERARGLIAAFANRAADPSRYRSILDAQLTLDGATHERITLRNGRTLERLVAIRRDAGGAAIGHALFIRDISEECRSEREAKERAHQQETVAKLAEVALNASEPQPVFALTTQLVAATLSIDLVHILEVDPQGAMKLVASNAPGNTATLDALWPRSGSMAHQALERRAFILCPDLAHTAFSEAPLLRALGVVSSATVVVRGRDRPFGVLTAHVRQQREFSQNELHFLDAVANVLAGLLARQQAEAALRDRERQLRAVFDNALDGFITFASREGTGPVPVDANPAVCRIFGRSRAETLRTPAAELFKTDSDLIALERRLVAAGRMSGEFDLAPADVPHRQIEYAAAANILPGLHLVVIRDVTETRAIQERLAVANRMASVGTLAAGVAHELNNPLACIAANLAWATEHLSTMAPDGEITQALADARDAAERMRTIIRNLQTFSRADDPHTGPVDLPSLLEACLHVTWNEFRGRAQLVRDLHPTPPVFASEARLSQVFVNLLVNASQALGPDEKRSNVLRIGTHLHHDGRVAVEIEDTGCGIPPEQRSRIFDPFFTTKAPGAGVGLGLSLCHNFVTSFGGVIEVESTPGKGSLFRVLLRPWSPRAVPSATPVPSLTPLPAPTPISTPIPTVARARILVVDDEEMVATAIRRALKDEHDVVAVSSAAAAIQHFEQKEPFDLVLCDLLMPDLNGIDLWRRLEELDPLTAGRMLFLTGGAFTGETRAFAEEHRTRCIEKPFSLDALRALVRQQILATKAST